MLVELHVRNLGVIDDLTLHLGEGMTALTGETGAGKTLLIEALELLMGGRADPTLVRAGAQSALIEGRFVRGALGEETVLQREIPAEGRSRAYVDGRMANAGGLSEVGAGLVDLHGQHAHQSLLRLPAQRASLDRYGAISSAEVEEAEAALAAIEARLADLGGDERQLAREVDLLSFQLEEIERAALEDPEEEAALQGEEALLAGAEALREAAALAHRLVGSDEGAADLVGQARSALEGRAGFETLADRLVAVGLELEDVAGELRARAELLEDDPVRLAAVQERRHLLSELRRKYGSNLAEVIAYRDAARARLADLVAGEARRAELAQERESALSRLARAEEALGDARRRAAPRLAAEIESRLRLLALPKARVEISVPPAGRGEAVEFGFGANLGEPVLPFSKVASGGELARVMLATRLVLSEAPPTLVFDEVDAGIGGEAALYVGQALAELGERHQVLVVTHLAQVAAFAGSQVAVRKSEAAGRTVTSAARVEGEERLAELSRMLSGQPESVTARQHATELLTMAASWSAAGSPDAVSLSGRTPGRTA